MPRAIVIEIDVVAARELVESPRWVATVEEIRGCHLWNRSLNRSGYGTVRLCGRVVYAHRVAWVAVSGRNPDPDSVLDHFGCDNPSCVNPEHVRPVTMRENILRGTSPAAAHLAKTHCPVGHAYTADNITASHAKEGRRDCLTCNRSKSRIQSESVRDAHRAMGLSRSEYAAVYGKSAARAARIAGADDPAAQAALELEGIAV